MSQIAIYIGWYDGNASGPFAQPTVEFMPGAFAYHLHSYSASTLRSTNQAWVGPLLAKGATATMGCVAEPYLSGTPDMAVFTSRLIYNGFTFGEAACAGQPVLSWQTTVVGDPLYRPFAKSPDELLKDLVQRHSPWAEWAFLRVADINLASGRPPAEIVALLEQLENTKQSAVLTEKLGDLYAAQGKPSSAVYAYFQALKLDPTPQQRIRLRLTLGEKLVALDRRPEAFDVYEGLLKDSPAYPDEISVCRRLLAIAHHLHRQADADKYQAEINRLMPPPPPATPPATPPKA
jgi:tetratricopeptide (TPR) repeat protein